jgi:hypothetical protein
MFFDLYKHVTSDTVFRSRVETIQRRLSEIEVKNPPNSSKLREEGLYDLLELCHWNPSLLVPYFYPKYPENEPLSLFNRPFAMAMLHMAVNGSVTIRAGRQIAKALGDHEPVLTPSGWVPISQLKPGDTVYGGDGKPCKVTGVFPQGEKELFAVTFTDGSSVTCCNDHLWKCRKAGRKWMVKSLGEIRKRKGGDNPSSDQGLRIPLVQPVELPSREHHVHPYVLGVLIGDGSLTKGNLKLTSCDELLVNRVRDLQPDVNFTKVSRYSYHIGSGYQERREKSKFRAELDRMGLRCRAEGKFIPEEYMHDSADNRLELLRGLMDTDGTIREKGMVMSLTTVSEVLARQVVTLVQSLGGTAKIKKSESHYTDKQGTRHPGLHSYRVHIRLWNTCPFWLPRKAGLFYNIRYKPNRVLQSVKPVGTGPATCITVDSPDHTFVTKDFIVTHNSTTMILRQRLYTQILAKYKSMYVAPHQSFRDIYANRMREMDQAFRFASRQRMWGGMELRDNLKFKELPNGSRIRLVKCHTDVFEARSDTADEVMFDEYQFLDTDLEHDILQCRRASKIPSALYAGTSTTVDSPLEYKYQESSMGQWHVRKPLGNGWYNFSDPEEVMKLIKPRGLFCHETGRRLNVRDGEFVHEFPSRLDTGMVAIGLHVPQVIVPEWSEKLEEWIKIYRDFLDMPKSKFYQECLGVPVEEGHREITERDLKAMCCLPFTPESILEKLGGRKSIYTTIISGIDWGGSDYQREHNIKKSYTVHVIIGILPNGLFDILFFRRHSGANFDKITHDIVTDHCAYKATWLVSDFGVGNAYHYILRKDPRINPERHFIFGYTGPKSQAFKEPGTAEFGDWSNHFSLNKTESITMLFRAIKSGKIRCFPWEIAKTFLDDFLNLYRALAELPGGETLWKYLRNPAKTDDSLHAVNFAYTLGRLLRGEQIVEDPATIRRLDSILRGNNDSGVGIIDMSSLVVSG